MFQKVLTGLFDELPFVLVYIDDIIIFSKSFEEHARHVKKVMKILNSANLKVNPAKGAFGKTFRFAGLSMFITFFTCLACSSNGTTRIIH
jgi:hypothetical protein